MWKWPHIPIWAYVFNKETILTKHLQQENWIQLSGHGGLKTSYMKSINSYSYNRLLPAYNLTGWVSIVDDSKLCHRLSFVHSLVVSNRRDKVWDYHQNQDFWFKIIALKTNTLHSTILLKYLITNKTSSNHLEVAKRIREMHSLLGIFLWWQRCNVLLFGDSSKTHGISGC